MKKLKLLSLILLTSNQAIAEGVPYLIGKWRSDCINTTIANINNNYTDSNQYEIIFNEKGVYTIFNSYGGAGCNGEPSISYANEYGFPWGFVKKHPGTKPNELILESYEPNHYSIKTQMNFINDDEVIIKLLNWSSVRPVWEAPQKTIDTVNLRFRHFYRVKK